MYVLRDYIIILRYLQYIILILSIPTAENTPDPARLAEEVRVLVMIITNPKNLDTKTRVVRDTWARRANKAVFIR